MKKKIRMVKTRKIKNELLTKSISRFFINKGTASGKEGNQVADTERTHK